MSAITSLQDQRDEASLHLGTSPIRIRRILAATDFSEQATLALKIAARLAKQLRSRLYVLHTVVPQVYTPGIGVLAPVLQEVDLEGAREQLHEYAIKIPEVRTVKHEEIVLNDTVIEAISGEVESKIIDLVVMGSHGRGGLGKLLLGSNAENAIRHLHCPILVVGPRSASRHWPLKSMVFATDLTVGSLRAAQYATSIAQESGAALTLVHVLAKPREEDHDRSKVEQEAMEKLRQLIPSDIQLAKQVHFEIATGGRADQILHFANHRKAGLIVMGVRERGALANHASWATLSEVIHTAHCPILAVPPHLV
jgi:nucleotide-binding universal stress UspA family protein